MSYRIKFQALVSSLAMFLSFVPSISLAGNFCSPKVYCQFLSLPELPAKPGGSWNTQGDSDAFTSCIPIPSGVTAVKLESMISKTDALQTKCSYQLKSNDVNLLVNQCKKVVLCSCTSNCVEAYHSVKAGKNFVGSSIVPSLNIGYESTIENITDLKQASCNKTCQAVFHAGKSCTGKAIRANNNASVLSSVSAACIAKAVFYLFLTNLP